MALYVIDQCSVDYQLDVKASALPIPEDADPNEYIPNPKNAEQFTNYRVYQSDFPTRPNPKLGTGGARCYIVSKSKRQGVLVTKRCDKAANAWNCACSQTHHDMFHALVPAEYAHSVFTRLQYAFEPSDYPPICDDACELYVHALDRQNAERVHYEDKTLDILQHSNDTTVAALQTASERHKAQVKQREEMRASRWAQRQALSLSPPPNRSAKALAPPPAQTDERVKALKQQLAELTTQNAELKKLTKENAELKKSLKEKASPDLQKQNAELIAQNKAGYAELTKLVAENEQLKKNNAEYAEKNALLVQEISKLTDVPADLVDF
ncbi:hypothetical protein CYMTET_22841 [Cymbomonas tetramitiformis]|uniref:Uncharacterized protein n=1 Tax=Cymbomonas tetramitiformis TaxID=36881 RepID=A0AAE0L1I0_9CHLO|nr:hypothetical protein CYMTET_22841 [Cymbomonas tetramitiformis]